MPPLVAHSGRPAAAAGVAAPLSGNGAGSSPSLALSDEVIILLDVLQGHRKYPARGKGHCGYAEQILDYPRVPQMYLRSEDVDAAQSKPCKSWKT